MSFSISRRRSVAGSRLVAAGIAFALLARAAQAEDGTGGSLDDYLRRLGYLPLELNKGEHDQLLAEGVLAEKRRLFLIDTGWGRTALDESAARGLKSLGELGVTLEDTFGGKVSDASVVLMDKLAFGRAQFLNQPAKVMKLRMDFVSVQFDGVLGSDFFFRNYCLIDCLGARLYVRGSQPSKDVSSALDATLRQSGFIDVPINVEHGLIVEGKVNDEPLKLVVDTGGTVSVLDTVLARRLGLKAVKRDEPTLGTLIREDWSANLSGFGKIGAHKMWVTLLKSLEISPLQWTNIHFGVVDLKSWSLAEPGTKTEDVQGLLGREMLLSRGALIDYPGRKLWFRPQKSGHADARKGKAAVTRN